MRRGNPIRFGRNEEDEGLRQKKKYEETLKLKKEMLKQEFEHLEEIRKYDELSVNSLNEVKFKNEFDKLQNMRKHKQATLDTLNKTLSDFSKKNQEPDNAANSANMMASQSGFRSMVNNHHSDPLYQTFSKNLLVKGPTEYAEYIQQMQTEQERYQQLIEMEKDKAGALEVDLREVEKSNIKLQQEIQELQMLNKVANKRFYNIEAVQFLSHEKKTISHKNLKTIKSELKEMQEMRKQFRKKQQEKQKEYQKEIFVGEEYVSHNGMKIEEAEQKNADLEREIQLLEQKEKYNLEKRQKSYNILQYIASFQMFERIFMNKLPPEMMINAPRLVDQYQVNEDLLYQQGDDLNEELKAPVDDQLRAGITRDEVLLVIESFFQAHPEGASFILRYMIEKYWQFSTELQQNNQTYEVLLQDKTHYVHQMEQLEAELQDILSKNLYMQQPQDGVAPILQKELQDEVSKIEGIVDDREQVAYDTGLFVSHMTRGSLTTTLNIVRLEFEDVAENKTLTAKNLQLQNLLFNFFLSFSQLMYRAAQTLQIVSENSYNITSMDLNQHVQAILTFVEQIWSKQQTQKRKESKIHKKSMLPNSLLSPSKPPAFQVSQSYQEPENEPVVNETQINYYTVANIFEEVFVQQSSVELSKLVAEASRYFYIQCKQDQLIWMLLSPVLLRAFLYRLKKANAEYLYPENVHKLKLNTLLPSYQLANLRQELVLTFSSNFLQLLNFYQVLDLKLKDLSSELKIYLKEKDPKFDSQKLKFIPTREGLVIKEARQAISRKMDLYRTGEVMQEVRYSPYGLPISSPPIQTNKEPVIAKIFHGKALSQNHNEENQETLLKGLVKLVQPEINAQQESFLQNNKEKYSEEELYNLKQFYHGKLHHKYEPSVQIKKAQEETKHKQNVRTTIPEKDEFDEERDTIKGVLYHEWASEQERNAQKNLLPQELEQVSEKKAQIKGVTDRLYGIHSEAAMTLKTMSLTTAIISDIDKLEKQPSDIEQPFLISNFKLQKKTMHRNLNKELSLPTLHFLKPTSAYFARRQQSQEQLRAMAQKKYDLIESGMAPTSTATTIARPVTEMQKRKMKTSQQEQRPPIMNQQMTANVEKFYQRYGSQEQSAQFLGYLMNRQGEAKPQMMTLQEFPFQFNGKRSPQSDVYRVSGGGARPKSILVYPQP